MWHTPTSAVCTPHIRSALGYSCISFPHQRGLHTASSGHLEPDSRVRSPVAQRVKVDVCELAGLRR